MHYFCGFQAFTVFGIFIRNSSVTFHNCWPTGYSSNNSLSDMLNSPPITLIIVCFPDPELLPKIVWRVPTSKRNLYVSERVLEYVSAVILAMWSTCQSFILSLCSSVQPVNQTWCQPSPTTATSGLLLWQRATPNGAKCDEQADETLDSKTTLRWQDILRNGCWFCGT